jgi:hypothetical protein
MKTIKKFINEISGEEFSEKENAIKAEKKSKNIKNLFSFWHSSKDDNYCSFANGKWCYQRTKSEYNQLIETLVKALKKYEPWITKQYKEEGGLQSKHIGRGYMIGRYLCDGNSELYHWYCLISNICPKCFREWGQLYFSNTCTHNQMPLKRK